VAVVAITKVLYHSGEPGSEVQELPIGERLDTGDRFTEDELEALVLGGSAVETGKTRKYSPALPPSGPVDEDTEKRDELIRKSMSETSDEPEPEAPKAPAGAK